MNSKYQSNDSYANSEKKVTASITNWEKLKLLFWKNWILQWSQKTQLIFALVLPIFFMLLVLLLRRLVVPNRINEIRYNSVSIDDLRLYLHSVILGNRIIHENGTLNIPKYVLCFTPHSDINLLIVEATVLRLGLFGWRAYDTAKHMEYDLVMHNFLAGVEFQEVNEKNRRKDGFPLAFNITIRFPSELRTVSTPIIDTWRTSSLYPGYDFSGPRNHNASDGGVPVGYLMEGFLPLQHALTMSWLQLGATTVNLPQIQLQRFPYNSHVYDPLLSGLQQLLPFMLLLSFIYPCSYVTKYVTNEKELQLKEVMKLMGLHNWLHWSAWFVKSYLLLMIVVLMLMGLLLIKFYKGVAILTYSNWLPLLIFLHTYVVASICFCFMLAVFFSKASTAAAVTSILWFLTYIPYSFAFYYYERLNLTYKMLLCLLSNTALGFGIHVIMGWEGNGEGVNIINMFDSVSADDSLSLFYVILMMTFSAFIYMLICLYVEQIYPGEYGVPRQWNYPFQRDFWACLLTIPSNKLSSRTQHLALISSDHTYTNCYEPIVSDMELQVGIQLRKLKKTFGKHTAVKDLTLNMYRNEITVLLGHNGAGKTTTILMLTGITPPTSGKAYINGYNITTELDKARHSLGICPQHNVLFNDMSVRNHIIFFSKLKGVQDKIGLEQEISKYLELMQLEDKEHAIVARLSGGMKRKLSLCCALCGDSKTVICDEPSSGVDTAARRRLWDLLQSEKKGRTVLLTTHHMDEADVLGDRIAILCDGQLQCHGTPFYLKKRYGSGYKLICVKRSGCNSQKVTALLDNHISGIQPDSELGSELTYRLPSNYAPEFAKILNELEEKSQELQVDGYGISMAGMEEVFINVGMEYKKIHRTESNQTEIEDKKIQESNNTGFEMNLLFDVNTNESRRSKRILMRWQTLLGKKILIARRNYYLLLMQVFLPVVFILLTIMNSRGGRIYYSLPAMHISLTQYSSAYVVLEQQNNNIATQLLGQIYADYIRSHGSDYKVLNSSGKPFEDYILKLAKEKHAIVDFQYMAGATLGKNSHIVWLNNKPLHTAPLTLNLLHNALARQLLTEKAYTGVTNKPLPYSNDTQTMRLNKGQRLGAEISVNLCLCMCFVSAFYVLPVVKERTTRAKLLQYLSGVSVTVYWSTHLLFDYAIFIVIALLAILTIGVFHEPGYSSFADLGRYLVLLLIFGMPAILFCYVISFCFSDAATGFTRTAIIFTLTGAALFTLVVALSFEAFHLKDLPQDISWYFRIFPHFCLANGMHKIHIGYNIRRGCSDSMFRKLAHKKICENIPICCDIPMYFAWKWPGILPEIIFLLATGICMLALLLILDSKECTRLRELFAYCFRREHLRENGGNEQAFSRDNNSDIIIVQKSIDKMTKERRNQLPLVAHRISKRYGSHLAVRQLSFYVAKGECFGLLGTNGAGKTTTFKMLTGDVTITSGVAYVDGINLRRHIRKIYSRIGYCPQFDALFEELTGRETVRIFCMLRGVQKRYIKNIAWELAVAYGFLPNIDKLTRHYSGGNKRKLSAALASIGNPSILYLDEPTSGMDPGARRQLWNMLVHIRKSGKSIMLTSHSMEECEALCTRLAIMVKGKFVCMGSTQHLKNRFSKGLILKVKVMMLKQIISRSDMISPENNKKIQHKARLKNENAKGAQEFEEGDAKGSINIQDNSMDTNTLDPIILVKQFIEKEIPYATLQEEYQGLLSYYIPMRRIKWSDIFSLIEENRERLNIEDYFITQTTLEEIFLEFVRGPQNEIRTRKRCWCCC